MKDSDIVIKKKIVIVSIVTVFVLVVGIYLLNYNQNHITINESKIDNDRFAIFIDYGDGNYRRSTNNEWDFENYTYIKSECDNGAKIELSEDYSVTLNNVTGPTKCNLYFQIIMDNFIIAEFDEPGEHVVPITKNGYYKLEVWGASGGYAYREARTTGPGGYGGYSVGTIKLFAGTTLYANVGGAGVSNCQSADCSGGYNGGADGLRVNTSLYSSSGGGATHIATVTKSDEDGKTGELKYLSEYKGDYNSETGVYESSAILIVAGGGGGGLKASTFSYNDTGGNGGGYIGGNAFKSAKTSTSEYANSGGTQNSSSFGEGISVDPGTQGIGGSGGGFFGGVVKEYEEASTGAGGSGYIGNPKLFNKHMACYNCSGSYSSDNEATKTIAALGQSSTAQTDYAKLGNGYVKITYCGEIDNICQ